MRWNIESETKNVLWLDECIIGETAAKRKHCGPRFHGHYEQRFLDHEYIFQQDYFGSKLSDSQNFKLQLSKLTH